MAAAPTTSRLLSRFAFPPATHTFAPQSRDQASRTFSSIASQRSSPTPCARCFSTALRSRPTGSTESDQRSLSVAGASRRHLHSLPPLPGAISTEAGCQPFLSSETVQLIGTIWQGGLLQRLNDEVKNTTLETASVVDTVIGASQDRSKILAFNLASQALNTAFFLSNLQPADTSKSSRLPPRSLLSRIERDFDSLPAFKSAFSAAAMGMSGSGWVWLVSDQEGRLGIVPTFGAGTVLVQNRLQRGSKDFQASVEESVRRAAANASETASAEDAATVDAATTKPESSKSLYGAVRFHITGSGSLVGSSQAAGARDAAQIGAQLTPLLVLSVHEHAWLPDYGIWGKEPYLMNFWNCVDWQRVAGAYEKYGKVRV